MVDIQWQGTSRCVEISSPCKLEAAPTKSPYLSPGSGIKKRVRQGGKNRRYGPLQIACWIFKRIFLLTNVVSISLVLVFKLIASNMQNQERIAMIKPNQISAPRTIHISKKWLRNHWATLCTETETKSQLCICGMLLLTQNSACPKVQSVGTSNIYLSEPTLSMTRSWKRRLTAMRQSSEWQRFVTIQINRFIVCFIECLRVCLLACLIDSLI